MRCPVYPFSIPNREVLVKIGADPDTSVELPAEYGGGYEGILGMTHQLHCIVREFLYSVLHETQAHSTNSTSRRICGSTAITNTSEVETPCSRIHQKHYMATLVSNKRLGFSQCEKTNFPKDTHLIILGT